MIRDPYLRVAAIVVVMVGGIEFGQWFAHFAQRLGSAF